MYIDTKCKALILEPMNPENKPLYDYLAKYQSTLDGSRLYDDLVDVYVNQELDYKERIMEHFEVENPIIDDVNPIVDGETIGECEGCHEEIYVGEDIYDLGDMIVHSKSECCRDYISHIAVCRVAGE